MTETVDMILTIVLEAGKESIDLLLWVLLPIMVVMMAIMRLLEGILERLLFEPLHRRGLPAVGYFLLAAPQTLFFSFAAPATTLSLMSEDARTDDRTIAAVLAAIFTMSQANAVFPLLAVGLSAWFVWATSLVGGAVAALIAFKCSHRTAPSSSNVPPAPCGKEAHSAAGGWFQILKNSFQSLRKGGEEGVRLVRALIPTLILTILALKVLEAIGVLTFLETGLIAIGLPPEAASPLITKYLTGGTAMMGVVLEDHALTGPDLNRVAGFMINPLDPIGFAVLVGAVSRVAPVAKAAIFGAISGVLVRGILHWLWF